MQPQYEDHGDRPKQRMPAWREHDSVGGRMAAGAAEAGMTVSPDMATTTPSTARGGANRQEAGHGS